MSFVENTKIYAMNRLERNIIIGSLLGDGSLALYDRSKNAYYREHGCTKQVPYRQWKADKLKNLDFKLLTTCKIHNYVALIINSILIFIIPFT